MLFIRFRKYSNYIDLFIPSIHDAGEIFTQEIALKYISTFTKGKSEAAYIRNINELFVASYW